MSLRPVPVSPAVLALLFNLLGAAGPAGAADLPPGQDPAAAAGADSFEWMKPAKSQSNGKK